MEANLGTNTNDRYIQVWKQILTKREFSHPSEWLQQLVEEETGAVVWRAGARDLFHMMASDKMSVLQEHGNQDKVPVAATGWCTKTTWNWMRTYLYNENEWRQEMSKYWEK